jgi:hypothetical protein
MDAKKRKALPDSSFVYPNERKYPIDTIARARNALSRAAQDNTSGSYATVARKVRAKYGDRITSTGKSKGRTNKPGQKRTKG